MAEIFKFPYKNIHVAVILSNKARVLQDKDSNSEAAVHLFQEATRYFLIDARSSREQILSLQKENNWLYDKYRSKEKDSLKS
jgi:hypothetical protein|tara:strand:- start:1305 stop:1550 length:246 start_codon:yes stop_codon:yes gene_type:complete